MASYSNQQEMVPDRRSSLDGPRREEMVEYPTAGGGSTSLPSTTRSKLACLVDPKSVDQAPGHNSKYAKFDINGPNVVHHDNIYLKPVTKTTVRHVEIEEIERVVTIDRHIHHIQYHFQDVVKPEPTVVDRHSYYELVDPRLNITQAEPIFHAPIEHKLKYQAVSREEFTNQQSAIRPASEMDHFEEHLSIGGVGRPAQAGSSSQQSGYSTSQQGYNTAQQQGYSSAPVQSSSSGLRQGSASATPTSYIPSAGSPRQTSSSGSPRQTSSSGTARQTSTGTQPRSHGIAL